MANHQGGMGDLDLNSYPNNNENEVNPHSGGALGGFLPLGISPNGGDQRFPNWVSGSNHLPNVAHESSQELGLSYLTPHTGNVPSFPNSVSGSNLVHYQPSHTLFPSNDGRAGVFPRNIDLNAEFAGNNHYNSPNVPLGSFCLHPNGLENHNGNNSARAVIDSGVSRYVMQEPSMEGSSQDARCLYGKRSCPEHSFREMLVGESSSMGAQAGNYKRRLYELNSNTSLNMPIPCTGPVCHPQHYETGMGHGTTMRPFSGIQNLNESPQIHSFHNQEASLHPGLCNHLPFSRSPQSSVGALSSLHVIEDVPNFHQTPQDTPSFEIMSSTSLNPPFLPVFTGMESATVGSFLWPGSVAGNNMLPHEIAMGDWEHIAANLGFPIGGSTHPSQNSSGGFDLTSPLAWAPGSNFLQNMRIPLAIINHPVLSAMNLEIQSNNRPSDSDSNSSEMSQGSELSFGTGNVVLVSQNQGASEETSENHAANAGNQGGSISIWAPGNNENRTRLMAGLRSTLQHLRSGGNLRPQDFLMLDHSIILHLLGEITGSSGVELDLENLAYEDLIALEEHMGIVDHGLTEEEIESHLRQEKFQLISQGSTEEIESCCICQEDYNENEDLGMLDCNHRFHAECIKEWLVRKNNCPICKQTALAAAGEEAGEEEEDGGDA